VNEQTMHWRNTTHDWASAVDAQHLSEIRDRPALFAPGGVLHLVLEVLAYSAEEAAYTDGGRCTVTLYADGNPIKKPVMATKDLRFFDFPDAETLPDGHPRRGMSVVAALSEWLVHTNRRRNGAWTQRYERGIPVTGPVPVDDGTTTGTVVHFMPDAAVRGIGPAPAASDLRRLTRWLPLSVEVNDEATA
jgi:DNA gyrase subunit B